MQKRFRPRFNAVTRSACAPNRALPSHASGPRLNLPASSSLAGYLFCDSPYLACIVQAVAPVHSGVMNSSDVHDGSFPCGFNRKRGGQFSTSAPTGWRSVVLDQRQGRPKLGRARLSTARGAQQSRRTSHWSGAIRRIDPRDRTRASPVPRARSYRRNERRMASSCDLEEL